MRKYQVQFIREQPLISTTGQITPTYTVSFMVGDHGPFTLPFSKDEFNPANVQQKLEQFAANIESIAPPAQ